MKRNLRAFILLLLVSFLMSCNQNPTEDYIELVGEAQGTTFYISYFDSTQTDFSNELQTILQEFDEQVSTYKPRSVINQFNDNVVDTIWKSKFPYLYQSFSLSAEVTHYTKGYFDAGVYPLIQLIKSSDSLLTQGNETLDSVLSIPRNFVLNKDYVTKEDKRSQFNFNAIAQGYSVDVLAAFFDEKGVESYMVEIGGELRVRGKNKQGKLWTISLESPNSTRENRSVQEMIEVDDLSVVTSGSYRKFQEIDGKKYSHAINPFTGQGVNHNLLSVTVVTKDASIADGLATAFLVMGKEKTIEFVKANDLYEVSILFIETNENGEFVSSYFGNFEKMMLVD
jgi:FAD:protein FMN transferase